MAGTGLTSFHGAAELQEKIRRGGRLEPIERMELFGPLEMGRQAQELEQQRLEREAELARAAQELDRARLRQQRELARPQRELERERMRLEQELIEAQQELDRLKIEQEGESGAGAAAQKAASLADIIKAYEGKVIPPWAVQPFIGAEESGGGAPQSVPGLLQPQTADYIEQQAKGQSESPEEQKRVFIEMYTDPVTGGAREYAEAEARKRFGPKRQGRKGYDELLDRAYNRIVVPRGKRMREYVKSWGGSPRMPLVTP